MKPPMKILALSAIAAIALLAAPEVLAQTTVAAPDTSFDISVIKESVLSLFAVVVTAGVGMLSLTLRSWIGAKYNLDKTTLDEKLQAIFDVAAKRGIAFAETTLNEKIPNKIDAKSEFIKTAAEYISSHWPDIVAKTGMTPKGVEDAVVSRLPSPTAKEADDLALVKAGAVATVEVAKPK